MNKVTHVIFDLNGLLLDTEPIYEAAVLQITRRYGKEYPREVRLSVLGTTEQLTIQIIINALDLPITEHEFERQYEIICRQKLTDLLLMNGAYRLIHHLHRSKIPFCLATSSSQKMSELKMDSHKAVFDLFHHKVFASSDPEVMQGKPAPDIFLVAAKRFESKPNPSECLVFEDSPNGVRGATSAGMQSVMVPNEMVKLAARKQATLVLESLADFKPEMFGLPPYPDKISELAQLVEPEIISYDEIGQYGQHKPVNKVTHVIFDLDGLLLDTEPIYEAAVLQITRRYGKEYPRVVRLSVLGTTEQLTIQIIINALDLPITEQEFERQYEIICRQKLTDLILMKGGYALIHHLHRSKIPFCLATSSSEKMALLKMGSHQAVFDLFNHKVFGSSDPEVKQGKPAPDIFLVAAKRFDSIPNPSECLVFEDSPNGVRAATSAGMQSVMVPNEMVKLAARKQATIVLESLADFKPEMFGLPPYPETIVSGKTVRSEQYKQATLII